MPFIVKNTTLPGLFDLVSPHSCRGCGCLGTVLCKCCKNNILMHRDKNGLNSKGKNLPPIYVVDKRNGILERLINDYKYYSVRDLAQPLAGLIDEILPKDLPKDSVVVPLPTASNHVRARGLDHTYLIAKNLSKLRDYKLRRIILRNKNTVQVGAGRTARIAQAEKAYDLNPRIPIDPEKTYVLLDDVWTTGASIKAGIKILKKAGAQKIIVALLAYS